MRNNKNRGIEPLVEFLLLISIVVPWLIGIVVAKGFWSTLFSVVFAPYGWYLTVEFLLIG